MKTEDPATNACCRHTHTELCGRDHSRDLDVRGEGRRAQAVARFCSGVDGGGAPWEVG